jgi:hypothetical protein
MRPKASSTQKSSTSIFSRTKSRRRRRTRNRYQHVLHIEQCEDRRMLAVFTVNSMLDNGDGTNTTLREAVIAANASVQLEDTIRFDETIFANGGTIVLTQGQLNINETTRLVIDGKMLNGAPLGITIDAATNSRIFNVSGGGDVTLDSLTLTGGNVLGSGGAIYCSGADLTIRNSTITDSTTQSDGGGIYVDEGDLLVQDSTISGNRTGAFNVGGGIGFYSLFGSTLKVYSSTIENNRAGAPGGYFYGRGGGLYANVNGGTVTIEQRNHGMINARGAIWTLAA